MYSSVRSPSYQDRSGHSTAFYKKVADDLAMPSHFVSGTATYDCPGADTGAQRCARHCAGQHGLGLVSFSVTGRIAPPPPPPPPLPVAPPSPHPPPNSPFNVAFSGATDACMQAGIYTGAECRDGGLGSVYPPYCDYGSQVRFAHHSPRESDHVPF